MFFWVLLFAMPVWAAFMAFGFSRLYRRTHLAGVLVLSVGFLVMSVSQGANVSLNLIFPVSLEEVSILRVRSATVLTWVSVAALGVSAGGMWMLMTSAWGAKSYDDGPG